MLPAPRVAGIALLASAVVLAGCFGAGGAASRPTPGSDTPPETPSPGGTVSPVGTPPITGTPGFPEWSPAGEPFESLVIGTAGEDEPHTYTIWNHDDEARTIRVRIIRNGSVVHDERVEFPAGGTLEVTLAAAANYEVTVGVVGSPRSRTFDDPIESFDCNEQGTNVAVLEGGYALSRTYRTMMACSTATDGS